MPILILVWIVATLVLLVNAWKTRRLFLRPHPYLATSSPQVAALIRYIQSTEARRFIRHAVGLGAAIATLLRMARVLTPEQYVGVITLLMLASIAIDFYTAGIYSDSWRTVFPPLPKE